MYDKESQIKNIKFPSKFLHKYIFKIMIDLILKIEMVSFSNKFYESYGISLSQWKLASLFNPVNQPDHSLLHETQHDGVKTTNKKVTPKILSKSISRMPMGSLDGH